MAESTIKITSEIELDVANFSTHDASSIKVKQGDTGTRYIHATIYNKGEVLAIPSGSLTYLNISRGDSKIKIYTGTVGGDGTLTFELSSWATELALKCTCDITILEECEDGGYHKITTPTFLVNVKGVCVPDGSIEDSDDGDLLLNMFDKLSEIDENETTRETNTKKAIGDAEAATAAAKTATEAANKAATTAQEVISEMPISFNLTTDGILQIKEKGEE